MFEVVEKFNHDEDEEEFCIVKDPKTRDMYLKMGDELEKITYYKLIKRFKSNERAYLIIRQDFKYKYLDFDGDFSLKEFSLKDLSSEVQIAHTTGDDTFFVSKRYGEVLSDYPFWSIREIRGDIAHIDVYEGEYASIYLGCSAEFLLAYDSNNRRLSRDLGNYDFTGTGFVEIYNIIDRCGFHSTLYIDILGNVGYEETQFGADCYKYSRGKISVYDLAPEYFKDPKLVKFVREREMAKFKEKTLKATSLEEIEKIKQEAMDFNDYMYSIFEEEYDAWCKKREEMETLRLKKEECEDIINKIL